MKAPSAPLLGMINFHDKNRTIGKWIARLSLSADRIDVQILDRVRLLDTL